jgi:putative transposase
VPTQEGWLYLAVILALSTRQVIGYSLAERMPDELVLAALRNACHAELPAVHTVFHSDRGSQYTRADFRTAIGASCPKSVARASAMTSSSELP